MCAYTEKESLYGSVLITVLCKDNFPKEAKQGAGYGRLLGSSRDTAFSTTAKFWLHQWKKKGWGRPGTYFLLGSSASYCPVLARSARLSFQIFPCKVSPFKFCHRTERTTSPRLSKCFRLTDEILHESRTGYQFSPDTVLCLGLLPQRLQPIPTCI